MDTIINIDQPSLIGLFVLVFAGGFAVGFIYSQWMKKWDKNK